MTENTKNPVLKAYPLEQGLKHYSIRTPQQLNFKVLKAYPLEQGLKQRLVGVLPLLRFVLKAYPLEQGLKLAIAKCDQKNKNGY